MVELDRGEDNLVWLSWIERRRQPCLVELDRGEDNLVWLSWIEEKTTLFG